MKTSRSNRTHNPGRSGGHKPTQTHKDKTKYTRKRKHKLKHEEEEK